MVWKLSISQILMLKVSIASDPHKISPRTVCIITLCYI